LTFLSQFPNKIKNLKVVGKDFKAPPLTTVDLSKYKELESLRLRFIKSNFPKVIWPEKVKKLAININSPKEMLYMKLQNLDLSSVEKLSIHNDSQQYTIQRYDINAVKHIFPNIQFVKLYLNVKHLKKITTYNNKSVIANDFDKVTVNQYQGTHLRENTDISLFDSQIEILIKTGTQKVTKLIYTPEKSEKMKINLPAFFFKENDQIAQLKIHNEHNAEVEIVYPENLLEVLDISNTITQNITKLDLCLCKNFETIIGLPITLKELVLSEESFYYFETIKLCNPQIDWMNVQVVAEDQIVEIPNEEAAKALSYLSYEQKPLESREAIDQEKASEILRNMLLATK